MSDDPTDEERLARYAADLAAGVRDALPAWVVRCVVERFEAWSGTSVPAAVARAADDAGRRAQVEVGEAVDRSLSSDVDAPRVPPLSLVRGAVRYPTEVLRGAGVPPVVRDEFAERNFPDDLYDLSPASFADLDPVLHEPGLLWGAATAHVHLARRRAEGRR